MSVDSVAAPGHQARQDGRRSRREAQPLEAHAVEELQLLGGRICDGGSVGESRSYLGRDLVQELPVPQQIVRSRRQHRGCRLCARTDKVPRLRGQLDLRDVHFVAGALCEDPGQEVLARRRVLLLDALPHDLKGEVPARPRDIFESGDFVLEENACDGSQRWEALDRFMEAGEPQRLVELEDEFVGCFHSDCAKILPKGQVADDVKRHGAVAERQVHDSAVGRLGADVLDEAVNIVGDHGFHLVQEGT